MIKRFKSLIVGSFAENGEEATTEYKPDDPTADDIAADENSVNLFKPGLVMDMSESSWVAGLIPGCDSPRFPYSRPDFLYLTTDDDINISADQSVRPVLCPKDPTKMPLYAGYAETINAGKTEQNEDQASARILFVSTKFNDNTSVDEIVERKGICSADDEPQNNEETVISPHSDDELLAAVSNNSDKGETPSETLTEEAVYFGIFDGHAGTGAALMVANCLHEHIRQRLSKVLESICVLNKQEEFLGFHSERSLIGPSAEIIGVDRHSCIDNDLAVKTMSGKKITRDCLIIGALQTAFVEMDDQIQAEKLFWRIPGGCAAIVAMFFMRRLYVANAGDCRAIAYCHGRVEKLSVDFTPDVERKRLQHIASVHPELLGRHYTRLEYTRRLNRKDLKKRVLYRDWYMDGWAQKIVKEADLREPLISDGPKKPRLLSTIGVSRGFGDHHLVTVEYNIPIKPFLTPVPDVTVFDLSKYADNGASSALTENDVLIIASDGLWDVATNEDVVKIVSAALNQMSYDDTTKYTLAAQDLVAFARGDSGARGWQSSREGGIASLDDITVFVIPLNLALNPPTLDEDDEMLQ